MGAKDTVKFKLRRPTFKCDMCPKKFLSSQALTCHINIVHKTKGTKAHELKTLLGKSVKPIEMAKKSVEESDLVLEVEPARASDVRKIEYECPQCFQCFAVYFSAFRHIQKHHCINSKGAKVPPNSLELIKPVRIEVCMKCNQRLRSNDPHQCSEIAPSIDPMATYICTGCKQQFNNLKLFDMHVTGLHCDEVETLFFPSKDVLNMWREDIEKQTKVKYLIFDKHITSKQIYHCTHLASSDNEEDNVINFCPSSIFVRDFTKSIQVHFYKQHFGHDFKYKLPDKFVKYKSKQLLKEPRPITEPFELKSLHMDFKTLMDFLLVESTKCDKATLEILHKKAQEMLTVVNNWDGTPKPSKRNMTDDQISETLETLDVKKKKTGDNPVEEATKVKAEPKPDEPVIMNSFSLSSNLNAEERPKRNLKTKQNDESPPVGFVMGSSPSSSKSSFNDSYKEFIDKALSTVKNNENQSKLTSPVQKTVPKLRKDKKKVVKTKIGQFKPSLSPKAVDVVVKDRRSSIGKVDFEYEVREQENDCNILVLKI
ncbi:hypothetical protein ABMA27_017055 [Loxostege sticticalis]|uniref:C2H2-type domain-containing protein n=1 Tax=Loxostege sticticalis TaxID=481309 RepID=A0ABR3GYG2_LOXSC